MLQSHFEDNKMRSFRTLTLTIFFLLASCSSLSAGLSTPAQSSALAPAARCGDGVCAAGETNLACPQDCPPAAFSGRIKTTILRSDGLDIAVMVASPRTPRYTEGAGIVVVTSPIFTKTNGFATNPDLASLGLIQVSYLWPGKTDSLTGARSSGTFDYGGEHSVNILRDVIRFAGNRLADKSGRYIVSMTTVPPLVGEVGVYAYSDSGIAAVRALSLYGAQMQGLGWFIGREIPTVDTISALEIGYTSAAGQPVTNPLYLYPAGYTSSSIQISYTNLRWEPAYTSSFSTAVGRPYLDLDGSGSITTGDYIFDGPVPVMFGKRYYSIALTKALLTGGALSLETWPAGLATPDEAAQAWPVRQTPGLFAAMQSDEIVRNMKVMLVFAQNEHAQVAQDKPHIHQLYQGFRFEARLWVRLNPDRNYIESLMGNEVAPALLANPVVPATPAAGLDFPDNPANTQPTDWAQIGSYAYPGQGQAGRLVPLAAVAEMADRQHSGDWSENLNQVIYIYPAPTPQP